MRVRLDDWMLRRLGTPDVAMDLEPATDWETAGWVAADGALRTLLPRAPAGMGQELGRWLVAHVRSQLGQWGAPLQWQWNLTMASWLYEHLGIADMLKNDRRRADLLLREGLDNPLTCCCTCLRMSAESRRGVREAMRNVNSVDDATCQRTIMEARALQDGNSNPAS